MIKGEGDIVINRPIEEVWKFLTDFENYPKWHKGMAEARQSSEGPTGAGTTVEVVAERCFGPLPTVIATVLEDKALQRFGVPCLFLVGENEKIYSARKAVKRLCRVAPRIQTEIIPHAGHDLSVVQADLVTRKILDFLDADAKGIWSCDTMLFA